jgi:hypothetical protein
MSDKETLKHNLSPAIDKFVTELLEHKDRLIRQGEMLDRRIKDVIAQEKNLKQLAIDNNKKTKDIQDDLIKQTLEAKKRSKELSDELVKQRMMRDEAVNINKEAKNKLHEADNIVQLQQQEFTRAKEITKNTKRKLDALQEDDIALKRRNTELNDMQRELLTQKRSQEMKAEQLLNREIQLMDRENKVKKAEKKYNFEQAKKENE